MSASHTSQIIEWNPTRGFGFVSLSGKRIFLHIRDFTERPPFLKVGDQVRFQAGQDDEGRPCATRAELLTKRTGLRFRSILCLLAILVLPVLAASRLPVSPWISFSAFLVISLVTWTAYRADKQRARSGHWRIKEAILHGLELIGGWPAAFLAQRHFRHKTSKTSFRFQYWLIVVLHQFLALDYLTDWRYSRTLWAILNPVLNRVCETGGSL